MLVTQPGPDNFLDLRDTPDTYSAQTLRITRVNAGETALEFATADSGDTLTVEIPTGTVNGVNTTFTVVNTPVVVVIDGLLRRATKGYTYAALTITVDPLTPPVYDIFSLYNA